MRGWTIYRDTARCFSHSHAREPHAIWKPRDEFFRDVLRDMLRGWIHRIKGRHRIEIRVAKWCRDFCERALKRVKVAQQPLWIEHRTFDLTLHVPIVSMHHFSHPLEHDCVCGTELCLYFKRIHARECTRVECALFKKVRRSSLREP